MASGKTEHYGLSQWEATDQVVRADFNADNAKVDAAIKNAEDKAHNAQATAENLVAVAFTPENLPFVVGTYTGNGAANRTISLGFTPRAVLVVNGNGETVYHGTGHSTYYGGLAVMGQAVSGSAATSVSIVDGGFQVAYASTSYVTCASNYKDYKFCYLALK